MGIATRTGWRTIPLAALTFRGGFWVSNEEGSGESVTYDIEESRNRIFFGGGCSAFAWLNCQKN